MKASPFPSSTPPDRSITRERLGHLAATHLREKIVAGTWVRYLPGENDLARQFQISRYTVRNALSILQAENLIRIRKGFRTEITGAAPPRKPKTKGAIRILTPMGVGDFGFFMSQWINEYRNGLLLRGFPLVIEHLSSVQVRNSPKLLQHYVEDRPADLWVLQVASAAMQKWFAASQTPAVLAGTPHPGIYLPFVDVHSRAAARHAAGLFLAAGYEVLAIVASNAHFAGDYAAIQGVHEAVAHRQRRVAVHTIEYSSDGDTLGARLGALLKTQTRPIGVMICQAYVIPAVFSVLNRWKRKVPDDLGVISLQSDTSLPYIFPPLTHYHSSPRLFARKLLRLSERRLEGFSQPPEYSWIMPKVVRGESLRSQASCPVNRQG
ncbi:MAG TPA: substrate-binding domain-containing protein [Chthoniobacteraceae bacterium]|nr:substrate-binding domain-containing protein [Chthoniobacteraceae bacterium]